MQKLQNFTHLKILKELKLMNYPQAILAAIAGLEDVDIGDTIASHSKTRSTSLCGY